VTVNGVVATDPGQAVQSGIDEVALDGELLRPPRHWRYYAFHKPRGVIVTARDELGRTGIEPYLRKVRERVFPVGRLDRASEGLLLVTNHGALAHALLHPRARIEKVYRVRVTPRPGTGQLERMARGVALGRGEWSAPAQVRLRRASRGGAWLTMVLTEGKKREVRRICRAVGLRVLQLKRTAFAGIQLGELAPGALRPLARAEIEQLRELTGLPL
jgi:pseudouridine synthase